MSGAHLPEWISKVDAHAEVTAGLFHAVHADPQLARVATTCCKGKNGKELRKRQRQSDAWSEMTMALFKTQNRFINSDCGQVFTDILFSWSK